MDILNKIQTFGRLFFDIIKRQNTSHETELLHSCISEARKYNHWFTEDAVLIRLNQICSFLNSENFISCYSPIVKKKVEKKLTYGIFSRENIPMEEFSTLLTVILSGNSFIYKTSEKSDKLISFFFEFLGNSFKELKEHIDFTDGLIKNADKYIFTWQNEERPEIKKYFEKKKTLYEIRYQSVAILEGNEDQEMMNLLGSDLFTFYGLGTGNVRKIFLPAGFDLTALFKAIEEWSFLSDHASYFNNYQYYKAIYLIDHILHLDNGFILLKEDTASRAPTGVLYYEYYNDKKALIEKLQQSTDISFIYNAKKGINCLKKFGDSVNQLLVPSENLVKFLQ